MNNIFEKDWAEESWGGFSGMSCDSDWCIVENNEDDKPMKSEDEKTSQT